MYIYLLISIYIVLDIHNPIPWPSSAAPSQLHSPSFNLRQSAVFIADIYLNGRCSPLVYIQPSLCTKRGPEHILSLPTAQPLTCPQQGGPGSFKGIMMGGSSSLYCSCSNIQQPFCKCGHWTSIPALSKLPSVPQFCLKVMFIAWLWLGW